MAELVLTATTGRPQGTRATRRLRSEGKVPGVVYGLGADPVAVSVEYSELRGVLTTDAGLNGLIALEVDGGSQLCIVKELQRHPVRGEVNHVDFIRLDPDVEVAVDVPIVLLGEAKKVLDENGMVDQPMFSLLVLSKPDAIPNELTVDVSHLEVGSSIRVGDLALPAGVRTEIDTDDAVAIGTLTRSTLEAIAEDEAAEAEAEAELLSSDEGGESAAGGDADEASDAE
jgi:large subunit ribosomal protein L25